MTVRLLGRRSGVGSTTFCMIRLSDEVGQGAASETCCCRSLPVLTPLERQVALEEVFMKPQRAPVALQELAPSHLFGGAFDLASDTDRGHSCSALAVVYSPNSHSTSAMDSCHFRLQGEGDLL